MSNDFDSGGRVASRAMARRLLLSKARVPVAPTIIFLLIAGCGTSASEGAKGAGAGAGGAAGGASGGVAGTTGVGGAGQLETAGMPNAAGALAAGSNNGGSAGSVASSAGAGADAGASGSSGTSGSAGASGTMVSADPGNEGDGRITIDKPFVADPAQTVVKGVPQGQRVRFTMASSDSKIYPVDGVGKPFSRLGAVYLPANYVSGTEVPFMIAQDGVSNIQYVDVVPPALDNLIDQKKVPRMAVIFIDPGPDPGNDHAHSERSIEYDSVSGVYTTFIESEVIPAAKKAVKDQTGLDLVLTARPEGRGTLGGSSGGACAFTMGWFHPELYQKVLSYSGSFQDLHDTPEHPKGAAEYIDTQHHLVASAAMKPLRVALQIGTSDSASALSANEAMFAALTKNNYHTRYIVANGGGHVDRDVQKQTLAGYLIWLWRGYPIQ